MSETDILAGLNPEQQAAVRHTEGPLLVYAGAGSGKTRVITHRIANLLLKGVPPYAILGLTFTNAAAKEMRERIARLTGSEPEELRLATFHSFCARLLRREGVRAGFTIYDEQDTLALIKRIMADLKLEGQAFNPKSARTVIDRAKDSLSGPAELARDGKTEEWIVQVYRGYEQALEQQLAFDYGDLIRHAVLHLRENPDRRDWCRHRWRYLLVDEYQDTNAAQYALLRELTGDAGNLCVVGDDRQSIYGWRGACADNVDKFKEDFPAHAVIDLTRNYRSNQSILDFANKLMAAGWHKAAPPLVAAGRAGGGAPRVEFHDRDAFEVFAVVDGIRRLRGQGFPLRSMAVMYRANWQSRGFEDGLRRNSVPYQVVSGTGFYERREVKDLLAYLKFLVNPRDLTSLERIINVPARGIGDKAWDIIRAVWATGNIAGLELKGPARKGLGAFLSLVQAWRADTELMNRPADLIERIMQDTDYLKIFDKEESVQQEVRQDNLGELISLAQQFTEEEEHGTTAAFLEEMCLLSDIDERDADADRVNLMTLHAAKGLEFDAVFLVGVEEGLLPHESHCNDKAEIEEERRLLYVGITRARQFLSVTGAGERRVFGAIRQPKPSRFLYDIGAAPKREEAEDRAVYRPSRPGTPFARGAGYGVRAAGGRTLHSAAGSRPPAPAKPAAAAGAGRPAAVLVEHPRFGQGKLLRRWGEGEHEMVEVDFRSVGSKTLKVKYANLRGLPGA
ncbi:MAG TPA: UvrD-helicase domain-containing protein [bacterium]|nr:UvrD-helicase domain-containing protein [bacterium]